MVVWHYSIPPKMDEPQISLMKFQERNYFKRKIKEMRKKL